MEHKVNTKNRNATWICLGSWLLVLDTHNHVSCSDNNFISI